MAGVVHFIVDNRGEVLQRIGEHLEISVISLLIALALALPLALWLAHSGRGSFLAINASNVGRALPSLALIAIAVPWGGLHPQTVIFALVLLGIPPILTNAYVGVRQVDVDVVEAARGTGMHSLQVLRGVEVPLAAPVIMAGIRTASVQIIATATLGALVATGVGDHRERRHQQGAGQDARRVADRQRVGAGPAEPTLTDVNEKERN
jgi:osmoprotectant transport system permease protein